MENAECRQGGIPVCRFAGRYSGLEAARAAAKLRRPAAQQSSEPGLLEVMVAGKSLLDALA
jgi:hypothetical protein